MRLDNYTYAIEEDKLEWIESLQMRVGLTYFGGKSQIGKYILNNIFNLSVQMKKDGRNPDIFIDAFTGGGKIALSAPYGWYKKIVMNDLNYGVYSFYKYCKEDYIALIKMIDKIGEIMCEDFFHLSAIIRSWGEDKKDEGLQLDGLAAAALTYWITVSSFNAITDPKKITYGLPYRATANIKKEDGSSAVEKDAIKRKIKSAHKKIPAIHEQLIHNNIIIENLDYRELIKKYNGLTWKDKNGEVQEPIEEYKGLNKLWYFDPPYHPYTLHGGKDAPYADTFDLDMATEMVDILAGEKEKDYGKLEYFIKSDYDTQEALKRAKEEIAKEKRKTEGDTSVKVSSQISWYRELVELDKKDTKNVSEAFTKIESYPFCKICVGEFDKGGNIEIDEEAKKSTGFEYIWSRGFSKDY